MSKIKKFFKLTIFEKKVFSHAVLAFIYYRFFLKWKDIKSILVGVYDETEFVRKVPAIHLPLNKLLRIVTAASRIIPNSTCLSKALAGNKILRSYGYKPALHIGVTKDTERHFAAHAWLSYDNRIILCSLPNIEEFAEIELNELSHEPRDMVNEQ